MFDIAPQDIAALNDTDLRELVVRLCAAELGRNALPLSALTAGGDQDTADGGIDVRVELDACAPTLDFIQRPATGFQVKVTDLKPGAIGKEMRPAELLRPAIRELGERGGAYIIVSGKASLTDAAGTRRIRAMEEAVDDAPMPLVDFYDSSRLAAWVNQYPGVALWVRDKNGCPLDGWMPWRNWSFPQESDDNAEVFLLDDDCRVTDGNAPRDGELSVAEGIARMRTTLSSPKGLVRLVGLSGTGKTRLAQALFEAEVGTAPLDPSLAVYTDLGFSPNPPPQTIIQRLVQAEIRTVVIVDNCPPETHKVLVGMAAFARSKISLLTIEYDVGDDQPESTEVVRLLRASDKVIEQLLARRHPGLSEADRRHIAHLAGNNSRLALAMARAVPTGQSIDRLSEKDLFDRLFWQRNLPDPELQRAAEVCSLVYSFDGEAVDGENAELHVLGSLAELSASRLRSHVVELRDRQLVQKRSHWRAVLPHVLANHLARRALDRLPPASLATVFSAERPRLLKSFARRLGYLHDSEIARGIVAGWLASAGWLGDLTKLDDLGWKILFDVAPVEPEMVLAAVERVLTCPDAEHFVASNNRHRTTVGHLLWAIALDASLFRRCVLALTRFVAVEPKEKNHYSVSSAFEALFQILLSGTNATLAQRLEVIEDLLQTDRRCGLLAMDRVLKTEMFSCPYDSEFGSRTRSYGWHPRNSTDITGWFLAALNAIEEWSSRGTILPNEARSMIADHIGGVWGVGPEVSDRLQQAVTRLATRGFWPEGWVAVLKAIRFLPDAEELGQLRALEEGLRPQDLEQRALAYGLSVRWDVLDIADEAGEQPTDHAAILNRMESLVQELGREVAGQPDVMGRLLPQFCAQRACRAYSFGIGLARGLEELPDGWQQMVTALESVADSGREFTLLGGFLFGVAERCPELASRLLDEALDHPTLGPAFPYLQCCVALDEEAVNRLIRATGLGLAHPTVFSRVGWGQALDHLPHETVRRLLLAICEMPDNGVVIAIDVLGVLLHSAASSTNTNLMAIGRDILSRWDAAPSKDNMLDYHAAHLVETCLEGSEGTQTARLLANKLAAVSDYQSHASRFPTVTKALMKVHPFDTLDALLSADFKLSVDCDRWEVLSTLPATTLLEWAGRDREVRDLIIASIAPLIGLDGQPSPTMLTLIDRAADRSVVLDAMRRNLWRSEGGRSPDIKCDGISGAVKALFGHADPVVAAWARETSADYAARAEYWRNFARQRDESFE